MPSKLKKTALETKILPCDATSIEKRWTACSSGNTWRS